MSIPANKPAFFATEEEVMDAAIQSGRARPSIAQLPDGTYALCSRKTARRMGWTFLCRLWTGTTPKAPAKPAKPTAEQRAADLAAVEAMLGTGPLETMLEKHDAKLAAKKAAKPSVLAEVNASFAQAARRART